MKLSVVIPAHNEVDSIAATVESRAEPERALRALAPTAGLRLRGPRRTRAGHRRRSGVHDGGIFHVWLEHHLSRGDYGRLRYPSRPPHDLSRPMWRCGFEEVRAIARKAYPTISLTDPR
jgi:hypothetical protein